MNYLTSFEDLEKINDLPTIEIDVPSWSRTVRAKKLSIAQIESISKLSNDDETKYFYSIIASSLIDDQGKRFITNQQATKLGEKSKDALLLIFNELLKLNGLDKTIDERESDLENNPLPESNIS
jgi:hypothetical protein